MQRDEPPSSRRPHGMTDSGRGYALPLRGLVKLFSSATATNVASAAKSVVTICEFTHSPVQELCCYRSLLVGHPIEGSDTISLDCPFRGTMPHVIVKLWPGKSEQQKQTLADQITKSVMNALDYGEESVSIAFEEVAAEDWAAKVYREDIVGNEEKLYKKPGYTM